jgi:hypothetical protein
LQGAAGGEHSNAAGAGGSSRDASDSAAGAPSHETDPAAGGSTADPSSGHPDDGGAPSSAGEANGGSPSNPDDASGGGSTDPEPSGGGGSGGSGDLLPTPCDEVVFEDAALESNVRLTLSVPTGPIPPELARKQQHLYLVGHQIASLKGLECFPNLTRLELGQNRVSDLAPIRDLARLTYLDLSGNALSELAPLAERTELEVLLLSTNPISDITPLAALTGLTTLRLAHAALSDIHVLAGMTELQVLTLDRNPGIVDTSALESLSKLEELNLDGIAVDPAVLDDKLALEILSIKDTGVENIDFLAQCKGLRQVVLAGDPLEDIDALGALTKLEHVDLDRTGVRDILPLASNTGIGTGDTVFEQDMPFDDCEAELDGINAMIARGATVLFPCVF